MFFLVEPQASDGVKSQTHAGLVAKVAGGFANGIVSTLDCCEMAKPENGSFWSELLSGGLYKRNQGRLARQLTAAGLGILVIFGTFVLSQGPLSAYGSGVKAGVPVAVAGVAAWVIFRLVNWPLFAEFLISVEAEMNKVSWASKPELYRATIVVLSTMFFLGIVLFAYDLIWKEILVVIGVLQLG
ncbi:MAG: preprotein translocase subunit SecE [Deltaproteobacteria bacterium]